MSGLVQEIQLLSNSVYDDQILAYIALSATCLFLYEVIITFPDEVRFVWRSSWSFISILHILIRYYTLAFLVVNTYAVISTNLSPEFCKPYTLFEVWGASVLVPAVDILILMRVYALYNQNKRIGAVLVFFWLAETAIIFYFTGSGFHSNTNVMPDPLPGILHACFPIAPFTGHNIVRGGAIAISCQAVYLGLALYKLARQIKEFQLWRSLTPLLRTFFRDGALYCFNVLAMYTLNVILVQHYGQNELEGLGEFWLVSIVSITAGRLVLNLRDSVQSDGHTDSDPYELQHSASDNGQFTSVIVLDSQRMADNPSADPYLSFLP